MTRFVASSAAALVLTVAVASVSVAQVRSPGIGSTTGGSSIGGSSIGGSSVGGSRGLSTGRSTTTGAPVQRVPQPATETNNQVAPSATILPGGGSQVPMSPGSRIGNAVPTYGTSNNSNFAGIGESAQRSSSIDCTGIGTRSSTGSGSTSTVTANCAAGGIGTPSILGSGGPIDVTGGANSGR
jgi:hypothetical protein